MYSPLYRTNVDNIGLNGQNGSVNGQKTQFVESSQPQENLENLQNIFQTGFQNDPLGGQDVSLTAPLVEEKVDLNINLSNKIDLLQKYQTWNTKQTAKLDRRINKVNKYFHKILKKMIETDPEFGAKFLEPMKISMDKWIQSNTRQKIFMMYPLFNKVSILLSLMGLLRFFKEKIWTKLLILLKKYLKVFYTHRIHYRLETDDYLLDTFEAQQATDVNWFRKRVVIFGFERIEKEEAEQLEVRILSGKLLKFFEKNIDFFLRG